MKVLGKKSFLSCAVAVALVGCGNEQREVKDLERPDLSSDRAVENSEQPSRKSFEGLLIEGSAALEQQKTGAITLNITGTKASKLTCKLDGHDIPCEEGKLTLNLSDLQQGSHRLVVVGADGKEAIINFCAGVCNSPNKNDVDNGESVADGGEDVVRPVPSPRDPLSQNLQVGYAYQLRVPVGMHVTEYSTTKTTNFLSFFRVMNHSDPHYLGNTRCDHDHDVLVQSISPSGEAYDYCHSTPTRTQYKEEFENRLAHNHVEIATDAAAVEAGEHERLSVSVYDVDYEFQSGRSRFLNLCGNAQIKRQTLPMLNDFFHGRNPEGVTFWHCDAIIPAPNGQPQAWKVGGFIDADRFDWQCEDCSYNRAIEVLYLARPVDMTWRDDYFARQAQERILGSLTKIQP